MRTFSAVLLLLASPWFSKGAETNGVSLYKLQCRHQAYEWRIAEERIAATPQWKVDDEEIPIAPHKAWQIAKDWLNKRGVSGPDLVEIDIIPIVHDVDLSPKRKESLKHLLDRYYYRIRCIPAVFDRMAVIVLMDGTVLEPTEIPHLPAERLEER